MVKPITYLTLSSVLFSSTVFAGGTIPDGFGMYDDGRTVETVPAGHTLRYRYYGALTETDKDTIMFGVASVDVETTTFKILWRDPDDDVGAQVQLFFSAKSDPLWEECTDGVPGGCTYGRADCIAKYRSGDYDLCTQYRVSLWMANINYGAQTKGIPQPEFLKGIVRHEVGHVLGFSHFDPGPMTNNNNGPFSPCQLEMWRIFRIDGTDVWNYPTAPAPCL